MYTITQMMLLALLVTCLINQSRSMKPPKMGAFFQGDCYTWNPCHHQCVNLPKYDGFQCICQPGYKLHDDGFSCIEAPETSSSTLPPEFKNVDGMDSGEIDLENQLDIQGPTQKDFNTMSIEDDYPSQTIDGEDLALHDEEVAEEEALKEVSWNDVLPNNPYDMMMGDAPMDTSDVDKRGKKERNGNRKNGRKGRKKGRKNKQKDYNHDIYQTQSDSAVSNSVLTNEVLENPGDLTHAKASHFRSCDELICQGGGKCVPDELRGGVRCSCKLGTEGEFCEKDVTVRYPKFQGMGYIQFPVLRNSYKEFTIALEFRPDTDNGLLMFSGEHPNARSDFFSIAIVDGKILFTFDCGTGPAEMVTPNKVNQGEWNKVTVYRRDYTGWVVLNDGEQVKGRSRGMFSRITFKEDLYLGGYKNNSLIGRRTKMPYGFVGCVQYLEINRKVYDMRKGSFIGDAIGGVDVGECSSGVCDGVKCNSGICVADTADTSVCLCPFGAVGDRCESKIDIYVPSFDGTSYLQYIGLRQTILSTATIEIVLKPMSEDGLIFYNGYTADGTGDFISLALKSRYVEFRFDLGTGPAIIRSMRPLTIGQWHVIRIQRTGRDGWLQIDKERAVEGRSKGGYTQLTLTLDLFIGGHRNFDEVAHSAAVHKSFVGCIQKVVINEVPLKLLENYIKGVNIDNCEHPCVGLPCMNGGRCVPMQNTFKCNCAVGYENTRCEDKKERFRYRFKRDTKEPITIPRFTGDSYLMYAASEMTTRLKGTKNDIQMRMKIAPHAPDGLIFWVGESVMSPTADYLALGLVGGHAQLRFNLGSGEAIITVNDTVINDGKWHKLRVIRYKQTGYLEVDGTEAEERDSPGKLQQLNIDNQLYLGGMKPDEISMLTMKKYNKGIVGCISNVTLNTDYHMELLGEEVRDGENIQQCED